MSSWFEAMSSLSTRKRIVLFLGIAIATRFVTFGNPVIHVDDEFYFATARAMTNGALPYVDIWDRKPVGLFLIYLLPASLPGLTGVWLYQAMALVSVLGTALLIARLADEAGWRRGGTFAGAAYLVWIVIAGGQGGQSPVFYNLIMAAAALQVVKCATVGGRWRAVVAMSLVGLALQIKYSVLFEGIYFGFWFLYLEWRRCRRLPETAIFGAMLAAAALLLTAAAFIFYASIGEVQPFIYENFLSILSRKGDPPAKLTHDLAVAAAILLPLLVMGCTVRVSRSAEGAGARAFLIGWLVTAIVAFLIVPTWAEHYTLPVMLPASVMAASFFCKKRCRVVGLVLIGVALIAGQIVIHKKRLNGGTPDQFYALAQAVGKGPGCLYVYSGPTMLYPATGRCSVSRYVFPNHIMADREAGSVGVDQMEELRRIFAAAPQIVVMRTAVENEEPHIRAQAIALLHKDYRLVGRLPSGKKRQMEIFERRGPLPPQSPVSRFD